MAFRSGRFHIAFTGAWVLCGLLSAATPVPPQESQQPATQPAPQEPAQSPPASEVTLTPAEQIVQLRKRIDEDEARLAELKVQGDPENTDSEYAKAEEDFRAADAAYDALRKEVEKVRAERGEVGETQASELEAASTARTLAKERFDLAIESRKTLATQIANLEAKIASQKSALAAIEKPSRPTTTPTPDPATKAGDPVVAPPTESGRAAEEATSAPTPPSESKSALDAVLSPGLPAESTPAPAAEPPPAAAPTPTRPETKESIEARRKADAAKQVAQDAEDAAIGISESIERLRAMVDEERKALDLARKKAENASNTEKSLLEEIDRRGDAGVAWIDLVELRRKLSDARGRVVAARQEQQEAVDRLAAMQEQLVVAQQEELAARGEADRTRKEAEAAQRVAIWTDSPLNPRNMLRWLFFHGPRLIMLVIAAVILRRIVSVIGNRIAKRVAGGCGGSEEERAWRAKTLVSVFLSAANVSIVAVAGLLVLQEVGVPVGPLLGGAAVVGLAVAFGAQSLIRDVFYGFFILLENQYSINDVVKVAGVAGLVEEISLRATVLRDIDGTVHFVPNGQITTVSNMTHGRSRALFDVGVAYESDVDEVMAVLIDLGKEMRRDPKFGDAILADPEMLGVDRFEDSQIVIRFFFVTRPLQQWAVKREFNRRMKKRFDELGIVIPFHQVMIHRANGSAGHTDGEHEVAVGRSDTGLG